MLRCRGASVAPCFAGGARRALERVIPEVRRRYQTGFRRSRSTPALRSPPTIAGAPAASSGAVQRDRRVAAQESLFFGLDSHAAFVSMQTVGWAALVGNGNERVYRAQVIRFRQ